MPGISYDDTQQDLSEKGSICTKDVYKRQEHLSGFAAPGTVPHSQDMPAFANGILGMFFETVDRKSVV